MSVQIPDALLRDADITPTQFRVFAGMLELSGGETDELLASLTEISSTCHLGKTATHEALLVLIKKGWLSKKGGKGGLLTYLIRREPGKGGPRKLPTPEPTDKSVKNHTGKRYTTVPDGGIPIPDGGRPHTAIRYGRQSDESVQRAGAEISPTITSLESPSIGGGSEGEDSGRNISTYSSIDHGTPLEELLDNFQAKLNSSRNRKLLRSFVLTPETEFQELEPLLKIQRSRLICILLMFDRRDIQHIVQKNVRTAKTSVAGYLWSVFRTESDSMNLSAAAIDLSTLPAEGDWTVVNRKIIHVRGG